MFILMNRILVIALRTLRNTGSGAEGCALKYMPSYLAEITVDSQHILQPVYFDHANLDISYVEALAAHRYVISRYRAGKHTLIKRLHCQRSVRTSSIIH